MIREQCQHTCSRRTPHGGARAASQPNGLRSLLSEGGAAHRGEVAVFSTARKLATLIYRLLRWGQPYVDEGAEAFEKRYRQQHIKGLAARAKELGYQLMPTTT